VDLWESVSRVPAALAQRSPQLQLSSVAESVVPVCVLHVYEDRTWQAKEVTLSALPAVPSLNPVAAVVAAAAHPEAAPLSLSILTNPDAPLWLTLSVWHGENSIPLLLASLLLLRLGYRLTLPLGACHLSKK
jgi:hypothetical protein